MQLLSKNKILTKSNLQLRGWEGNTTCHFCDKEEIVDHLFVECTRFRHVWFWLGDCQFVLQYWHTITDILQFSFASPAIKCSPFLIAFGAFAWTAWTNQNRVCFEYHQIDSVKSIVLNITHLLMYWSGNLPEAPRQGLRNGCHMTLVIFLFSTGTRARRVRRMLTMSLHKTQLLRPQLRSLCYQLTIWLVSPRL